MRRESTDVSFFPSLWFDESPIQEPNLDEIAVEPIEVVQGPSDGYSPATLRDIWAKQLCSKEVKLNQTGELAQRFMGLNNSNSNHNADASRH